MARLSAIALDELRSEGITGAAWARHHFGAATWSGDSCGCPDSRCTGFHHDGGDACGCLLALILDQGDAVRAGMAHLRRARATDRLRARARDGSTPMPGRVSMTCGVCGRHILWVNPPLPTARTVCATCPADGPTIREVT